MTFYIGKKTPKGKDLLTVSATMSVAMSAAMLAAERERVWVVVSDPTRLGQVVSMAQVSVKVWATEWERASVIGSVAE